MPFTPIANKVCKLATRSKKKEAGNAKQSQIIFPRSRSLRTPREFLPFSCLRFRGPRPCTRHLPYTCRRRRRCIFVYDVIYVCHHLLGNCHADGRNPFLVTSNTTTSRRKVMKGRICSRGGGRCSNAMEGIGHSFL
jgi:hypothetical protein